MEAIETSRIEHEDFIQLYYAIKFSGVTIDRGTVNCQDVDDALKLVLLDYKAERGL